MWLSFCSNNEPYGSWSISLKDNLPINGESTSSIEYKTIEEYFSENRIKDLFFVLTYGGEVLPHPDMIDLKG